MLGVSTNCVHLQVSERDLKIQLKFFLSEETNRLVLNDIIKNNGSVTGFEFEQTLRGGARGGKGH